MTDPSRPDCSRFRYAYKGCELAPLTSIFSNNGKVTSYCVLQNSKISPASPGSWAPNWLQGKPSTEKPRGEKSRCSSSRPRYCGVKPHLLAVLTLFFQAEDGIRVA